MPSLLRLAFALVCLSAFTLFVTAQSIGDLNVRVTRPSNFAVDAPRAVTYLNVSPSLALSPNSTLQSWYEFQRRPVSGRVLILSNEDLVSVPGERWCTVDPLIDISGAILMFYDANSLVIATGGSCVAPLSVFPTHFYLELSKRGAVGVMRGLSTDHPALPDDATLREPIIDGVSEVGEPMILRVFNINDTLWNAINSTLAQGITVEVTMGAVPYDTLDLVVVVARLEASGFGVIAPVGGFLTLCLSLFVLFLLRRRTKWNLLSVPTLSLFIAATVGAMRLCMLVYFSTLFGSFAAFFILFRLSIAFSLIIYQLLAYSYYQTIAVVARDKKWRKLTPFIRFAVVALVVLMCVGVVVDIATRGRSSAPVFIIIMVILVMCSGTFLMVAAILLRNLLLGIDTNLVSKRHRSKVSVLTNLSILTTFVLVIIIVLFLALIGASSQLFEFSVEMILNVLQTVAVLLMISFIHFFSRAVKADKTGKTHGTLAGGKGSSSSGSSG